MIGICVSTLDLREVGCTVRIGLPSAELTVEGGVDTSFVKVEGVAVDSGSNVRPLVENWTFGENIALPGESPFMVIWLNVSSRPDEGECLLQGD